VPVVAAAIFGLIGVLVGGVLNFVTTMYVQGRSDRSSLRSMARLAYDDCLHFQSTLVRALADGDWWPKGESIEPQLGDHDRKLLLGELGDAPSQDVAAAIGWATYLNVHREHVPETEPPTGPTDAELQMMRDTFCRLDAARWQLSGKVSGRRFRSFMDGGVLATIAPPTTLERLGICDQKCRERRQKNYGREVNP
jgi:hypothetical protein